jgi:hypothetical protein
VATEFMAPWLDNAPEADESSDIVIPKVPGQSVLRFAGSCARWLEDSSRCLIRAGGKRPVSVRLANPRGEDITLGGRAC